MERLIALEKSQRKIRGAKKSAIDFDTAMTSKTEHDLLGYVESNNVEALRALPVADILPATLKQSITESAQKEAKDAELAKAHAFALSGEAGTREVISLDGKQRAAAAMQNTSYRPLAPISFGGGGGTAGGSQGDARGNAGSNVAKNAVGTAAKVPRAQALLVTRTRTKPLTVAFNIRQQSGLISRALAARQQLDAARVADQLLSASAPTLPAPLGTLRQEFESTHAAMRRTASRGTAFSGQGHGISSMSRMDGEEMLEFAGSRDRSETIESQVSMRAGRRSITSDTGFFE